MNALTSQYRPSLGTGGGAFAKSGDDGALVADGVTVAPNPFSSTAAIRYTLADAGDVSLRVYDVLGREVSVLVNQSQQAGTHVATLDGSALPSGTYVYRLTAGASVVTGRMTLSR